MPPDNAVDVEARRQLERVMVDQQRLERSMAILEERISANGATQREGQEKMLTMIDKLWERITAQEAQTAAFRQGTAFKDGQNTTRWTLLGAGVIMAFSSVGYMLGAMSDWVMKVIGNGS